MSDEQSDNSDDQDDDKGQNQFECLASHRIFNKARNTNLNQSLEGLWFFGEVAVWVGTKQIEGENVRDCDTCFAKGGSGRGRNHRPTSVARFSTILNEITCAKFYLKSTSWANSVGWVASHHCTGRLQPRAGVAFAIVGACLEKNSARTATGFCKGSL